MLIRAVKIRNYPVNVLYYARPRDRDLAENRVLVQKF